MNLRQKRKRAIEAKKSKVGGGYNAGHKDKQEYIVFFKYPTGYISTAHVGATSRNQAKKYANEHMDQVAGGVKNSMKGTTVWAKKGYQNYYPRPLNKPKNGQSPRFYGNSSWNDYGKIRGTSDELGYGN